MCGDGRCLQDTNDCSCDDGQGGGGVVTNILGTAPIHVTSAAGVYTVSHDAAGTAGVYAYPVSVTTDATGHVTAITAGSAPTTAIWTPTVLGGYFGFNSSAPYLETGVGYNVGISGTGDTVVGNSSTTGVASNGSVVVGRASSAASTGDVVVGTTSQAIGASGGPRVLIGQTVVFTDSVEAVCVGYLGSGSGNDYFTGIGSRISCTANKVRSTVVGSTNTMQYDRAVMIGYGNGNTGTDATSVGYQAAAAQDSAALGSGATAGNTNCVALGKGASTTANDELCTGTQTRLRFPSLVQATPSANSYPLIWNVSTQVAVPADAPFYPINNSFSPTFTGVTINNGTVLCGYYVIGRVVVYRVKYTVGSTDSFSGALSVDLPISTSSTYARGLMCQAVSYRPASTYAYGVAIITGTNTVTLMTNGGSNWTNTTPVTWTTSDVLAFNLVYEY